MVRFVSIYIHLTSHARLTPLVLEAIGSRHSFPHLTSPSLTYFSLQECNNMPEPDHFAPTYSDDYGFSQGAQVDIFQTINHSNWTCPQSTAR